MSYPDPAEVEACWNERDADLCTCSDPEGGHEARCPAPREVGRPIPGIAGKISSDWRSSYGPIGGPGNHPAISSDRPLNCRADHETIPVTQSSKESYPNG
jgi:hypothetical protein